MRTFIYTSTPVKIKMGYINTVITIYEIINNDPQYIGDIIHNTSKLKDIKSDISSFLIAKRTITLDNKIDQDYIIKEV